jgi:hypothetical protein
MDFVVVYNRADMRIIIGIIRNADPADDHAIIRHEAVRLRLRPEWISLIRSPHPAPDTGELARLRRKYQRAIEAEDGDHEDMAALAELHQRILSAGVPLLAADAGAMRTLAATRFDDPWPEWSDGGADAA